MTLVGFTRNWIETYGTPIFRPRPESSCKRVRSSALQESHRVEHEQGAQRAAGLREDRVREGDGWQALELNLADASQH